MNDSDVDVSSRAVLALVWSKKLIGYGVHLRWPKPPLNDDFDPN